MKKAYFTVILTFILSVGFGQNYKDSVLLLNGKVYQCNVVGVEGLSLHLQTPKKDTIEDFYKKLKTEDMKFILVMVF